MTCGFLQRKCFLMAYYKEEKVVSKSLSLKVTDLLKKEQVLITLF